MSEKTIKLDEAWGISNGYVRAQQADDPVSKLEFIKKKEHYEKLLKFKVLPPNSQEQNRIGMVTARHWNIGPNNEIMTCLCVEKMFPEKHVECPVCKLKRELLAAGFTKEDLSKPSFFGPKDIFDPQTQAILKVIMTESDGTSNNWDQSHISILSLSSDSLMKWLYQMYLAEDTPDFLSWENGNLIKMSRDNARTAWDKQILDSSIKWNYTPEVLEQIKKDNEAITLKDLYKFPTDEEFLKLQQVCENWKQQWMASKALASEATVESVTGDNVPF